MPKSSPTGLVDNNIVPTCQFHHNRPSAFLFSAFLGRIGFAFAASCSGTNSIGFEFDTLGHGSSKILELAFQIVTTQSSEKLKIGIAGNVGKIGNAEETRSLSCRRFATLRFAVFPSWDLRRCHYPYFSRVAVATAALSAGMLKIWY